MLNGIDMDLLKIENRVDGLFILFVLASVVYSGYKLSTYHESTRPSVSDKVF